MRRSKKGTSISLGVVLLLIIITISILATIAIINDSEKHITANASKSNEAYASTTADGRFSYIELSNGTIEISKYKGTDTTVDIPATIDGKRVTSIGDSAFQYCDSLTSIVIPEGVTTVGDKAFESCNSLTSIAIPEGVMSIGDSTFKWCSSLKGILIPEGVMSIGNWAFSYCKSLTSITIPEGVTSIGSDAFYECRSLESITIASSVTSIGNTTFHGCISLTNITIPENVIEIGHGTFSGCSNLTSIVIPEGVTSIGASAFYGCNSLTNITIPEGVTSIGNSTFLGCSSLTSITIPNSITNIGDSAFLNCKGLKSIVIPSSVTTIGNKTFSGCSRADIVIPSSVTSMGTDVFTPENQMNIICKSDSIAHTYAKDNGIKFTLDDTKPTVEFSPNGAINNSITAAEITALDYGAYVTNYSASVATNTDLGIGGWRIFHSDGENIYLIADDYIKNQYKPAGKEGTTNNAEGTYMSDLAAHADYSGTVDIANILKTKLLSQYAYTSEYSNAKATAYLLDAIKWSEFRDSNGYAEYAIGGPTLELFANSYNVTHTDKTIQTEVSNVNGYRLKWNTDSAYTSMINDIDPFDNLYDVNKNDNSSSSIAMTLASPPWGMQSGIMGIKMQSIGYSSLDVKEWGIRPIVVLKSEVKLQKQSDRTYIIAENPQGGNPIWAQTHTETVTIADEHSGLALGASMKYGWSTSRAIEPTTWENASIPSYEEGAKSVTFTATGSGLTGKYYLWAKPETLKDTAGNVQTQITKSTNTYWFDNKGPVITANPDSGKFTGPINVEISFSDEGVGAIGGSALSTPRYYYVSTSDKELVGGYKQVLQPENNIAAINPETSGEFYIFVTALTDTLGNISTENGELKQIDGAKYHRFGPYTVESTTPEDTTPPTLVVTYSPRAEEWTNESVTVTITASEKIQQPTGWELSTDAVTLTKVYNTNKTETVTVQDLAGNESTASIQITNIDKTAPSITINPLSSAESKSKEITIIVADANSGLLSTNSYRYYLSTSNTALKGGTWTNYTSGKSFTIGTEKTGTYYLFVQTIKDKAGNESVAEGTSKATEEGTTYHVAGKYEFDNTRPTPVEEELEVTSNKYTIDNTYITKVQPKTNIEEFKDKLETNATEINVYNANNEKQEDTQYIGTGMKIQFKLNSEIKTLIVVVRGDVIGNGKSDYEDIKSANMHRLEKRKLQAEYFIAGDVTGDGKVNYDDLSKINRFRLNKIPEI